MHATRLAAVSAVLALATAPARAEPALELPLDLQAAAADWQFDTARVRLATNLADGAIALQSVGSRTVAPRAVLVSKAFISPPAVLEAEVRLPTVVSQLEKGFSRAGAALGLSTSNDAASVRDGDIQVAVSRGRARDDRAYSISSKAPGSADAALSLQPLYSLDAISPLMDESVRLVLERRVHTLPLAHERVHRLRLEVREGSVRAYVNGRLTAEHPRGPEPVRAVLTVSDTALVLGMRVRPLEPAAAPFVPVPLDDLANAVAPGTVPALPPAPGAIAAVGDVPVIRSAGPRGEDHLDLEPSVYVHRMGTMREGDARESVHPPEDLDVTRFTLRVLPRPYCRAWVLAASDGDSNSVPVITLRFYRPKTAWTVEAAATIPTYEAAAAQQEGARRVPMTLADGRPASLWLIPIDLDAAALAAEPMSCLELTKAVYPYRGFPDPAYYGAFPGGLPSGVHVYGLTLEEAPVRARGTGSKPANLYTEPEKPVWRVLMDNRSGRPLDATITLTVTDPYGGKTAMTRRVSLAADGAGQEFAFEPAAEKFGLYTVRTEVSAGAFRQSRDGTFLYMPRSERKARPDTSPWGLWCWFGGHDTQPSLAENARILKALGAINNFALEKSEYKQEPKPLYEFRREQGLGPMHYRLVGRDMPAWSTKTPLDRAAYDAYAEEKGREAAAVLKTNPDLQFVNVFAENSVSLRLTHGMSPWALGQPWFELDEKEQARLQSLWLTAQAAAEGVRKHAPSLKILFGHGAGNFAQPFLRLDDWDNARFDGFGMDLPQFERMPERQPRATEPSLLYFLHRQMQEKGLTDKEVVHLESYFPSTDPMGLTPDEQARSVVRTAVLSLSLGTTRFMRTWELHTSGDGWGSSHYGSCGLIGRSPEFNPKPAAEAFATMTRVLDMAKYDGWLETGSRSAFCVRFRDSDRLVYAAWTIRDTRPLTIRAAEGAAVTRFDAHGNAMPLPLAGGRAELTLDPMPQWLVVRGGAIESASAGTPVYAEKPAPVRRQLEDFESADWTYDPGSYARYESNHWDMAREPGRMTSSRAADAERLSTVMRVQLLEPDTNKPMVGFYGIFAPPKPLEIPGKAKALGLWVNGRSAWNRFIYEIVDARGETYLSCGTRDAWNCDDIHSWSSVNHDGWRYMRFPLPGNAPGDNYREPDSVWWGCDAEGVVDLPVRLTRIMVEMRPSMVYVDQMLPVPDLTLELDDLTAEYADEPSAGDGPVALQRAAAGALTQGPPAPLPNPHAHLLAVGAGPAPTIARVYPPPEFYNGTRLFVEVAPVEGAARYRGYVAAYADGRGAKPLAVDSQTPGNRYAASMKEPNLLFFDRLLPSTPMYVFVTAVDAQGRESKPSAIREVVLKDEFPFK